MLPFKRLIKKCASRDSCATVELHLKRSAWIAFDLRFNVQKQYILIGVAFLSSNVRFREKDKENKGDKKDIEQITCHAFLLTSVHAVIYN